MNLHKKKEREKRIVADMISLFCRRKHQTGKDLCPTCTALQYYAWERIDSCPYMETKTFCSSCPVHCYHKEQREQIRKVMRFAGPRMLLYRPLPAIRHMIMTIRDKTK